MSESLSRLWYRVHSYDANLITSALEAGIDTFLAGPEDAEKIRKLARVKIAGEKGDLVPGRDFHEVDIRSKDDENRARDLGRGAPVVLTTPDWEIIPIENLIAGGARLYWTVPDLEKARLAFGIMERGVEGVVLDCGDPAEIRRCSDLTRTMGLNFTLEPCEITDVRGVGLGDRVCVDTATHMNPNQGMLAGNGSAGMLLVQSESTENPYVAPRPFRVNLSAVHAYTHLPDGRTTYLSELKAGASVVIVDTAGKGQSAVIGRIKMERRPMLLVEFRKPGTDKTHSLLLQNAETVRVFRDNGDVLSVAALKAGDKVLGTFDKPGRHFGMRIDESIEEK